MGRVPQMRGCALQDKQGTQGEVWVETGMVRRVQEVCEGPGVEDTQSHLHVRLTSRLGERTVPARGMRARSPPESTISPK